jgi:hypothetical protein
LNYSDDDDDDDNDHDNDDDDYVSEDVNTLIGFSCRMNIIVDSL